MVNDAVLENVLHSISIFAISFLAGAGVCLVVYLIASRISVWVSNHNWSQARRKKRLIKQINKALNIKLYDWQIDYIFNKKPFPSSLYDGRKNGKTLAHVLATLFQSTGHPVIVVTRSGLILKQNGSRIRNTIFYSDHVAYRHSYDMWYSQFFLDTYRKLCEGGLKNDMIEVRHGIA